MARYRFRVEEASRLRLTTCSEGTSSDTDDRTVVSTCAQALLLLKGGTAVHHYCIASAEQQSVDRSARHARVVHSRAGWGARRGVPEPAWEPAVSEALRVTTWSAADSRRMISACPSPAMIRAPEITSMVRSCLTRSSGSVRSRAFWSRRATLIRRRSMF